MVSTTDGTTTDQLISQDLQKDLSKVVDNSEQLSGAKVTFNSNLTDEDKKFNDGKTEYSTWKTNASQNVVYYSSTSPQLTVKSTKDLNTQLTPTALSVIMKKAGFTSSENKDFKLNNENKIGVDKDMLHVSVTATDKGGKKASSTDVDLVIPTSDINFAPDKATVEISGANVNTKKQQVTFKYDVGIDSTVNFTKKTIDLDAGKNITNGTDVLEALGWKQAIVAGKQLSRNALMSTFVEKEGTGTNEINSEKMGNDIGVFNSKFTNFKVTETQSGSGLYDLTVSASPNEGYQWDDGTKDQKELTIATNVDINVKDAEVKSEMNQYNAQNGAWGITNAYTNDLPKKDLQELKKYYSNEQNLQTLLKFLNGKLDGKIGILNDNWGKDYFANVEFSSIDLEKTTLSDSDSKFIIATKITPIASHQWKETTNVFANPDTFFYVKIPFSS
ncbi:P35 family lipoprotein [Malacoplasma iowae]|uniref:P35 family lipoprotein n=1 Tax=Malacoplasma iowae TaxID=2116 RepID=UPI00387316A6|nr:P35 family lipoprotein [Malacoplasma iowae]